MIERALADAAATEGLGAALARAAPWSAPQALAVYLHGELGAGKTTLVRGLLRALGEAGTVRSPSFTLIESYERAGRHVVHADLYRLAGSADVASLGLRDEARPGVLLLVEWPERAANALPPADLHVHLSIANEGRNARLEAASPVGRAWLASAFADAPSQK
ncbi:MAG TPA: tRNA (adenosine(37)-N6)-threonylcarbamoyltransferase complex ATPase subunit type 1 TsaE [Steroidobacteraceae bacterium]|nr:tRNA (adenosine(37)-N6)-threonylcarbamoyltransferase complex ATPase subunit type 1 TsaE [Steroidobacteraceae bacterium]